MRKLRLLSGLLRFFWALSFCIRSIQLDRDTSKLDFPSLYLELIAIEALLDRQQGTQLAQKVLDVLEYIGAVISPPSVCAIVWTGASPATPAAAASNRDAQRLTTSPWCSGPQ